MKDGLETKSFKKRKKKRVSANIGYCTPFKKEKPSEGGVCDLPCEGDSSKICGGKHMASIYGMHLCDDTEEDLVSVIDEAKEAFHKLQHAATGAMHAVRSLTSRGTALMYVAAKGGDMESHDLGQAALDRDYYSPRPYRRGPCTAV